jgi:hypothetical protein
MYSSLECLFHISELNSLSILGPTRGEKTTTFDANNMLNQLPQHSLKVMGKAQLTAESPLPLPGVGTLLRDQVQTCSGTRRAVTLGGFFIASFVV